MLSSPDFKQVLSETGEPVNQKHGNKVSDSQELQLRKDIVDITIRVFCAGRLNSSTFPVNGESRSNPYPGYESSEISRKLVEEIDSFLAKYLFTGDAIALQKFAGELSSVSANQSSAHGKTSAVCGRLFRHQDVIYSCRDCALDNTCVMCATCFANSAHTGHNYRMYTSGGGGYCDCGDIEAWHQDAACRLHARPSDDADEDHQPDSEAVSETNSFERNASTFFLPLIRFIEQILTTPFDKVPKDLEEVFEKAFPAALTSWMTILFNDEIHSFDEVIRTLRHAVNCSSLMAENFATQVDRKGRTIIFYGSKDACDGAVGRVTQRSANENSKRMSLRVGATSFGIFQLQEVAVRILEVVNKRLLANSTELQKIVLNALETESLSSPNMTIMDSLLLADCSLWKAARCCIHQFFMATAFVQPECRRIFGLCYAKNYEKIMNNFVEKDFHHYKDSIVSLSVQLFTVPSLVATLVEQLDFVVTVAKSVRTAIEPAINTTSDPASAVSREIIDTSKLQSKARSLPSPYAFAAHNFRYILRSLPQESDANHLWSQAVEDAVLRGFSVFVHQLMKPFTGTDALTRRVGEHVEWDPVLTHACMCSKYNQEIPQHLFYFFW